MQQAVRIWIDQNWPRNECLLQCIKCTLLHCAPAKLVIFFGQLHEQLDNAGKVWDEPLVKVGQSKEPSYTLNITRHLVILDCCYLGWVHQYTIFGHGHPKEVHRFHKRTYT